MFFFLSGTPGRCATFRLRQPGRAVAGSVPSSPPPWEGAARLPPPALHSAALRGRPQKKVCVVRARRVVPPPNARQQTRAHSRGGTTQPAPSRAPPPKSGGQGQPQAQAQHPGSAAPGPARGFPPRTPSNICTYKSVGAPRARRPLRCRGESLTDSASKTVLRSGMPRAPKLPTFPGPLTLAEIRAWGKPFNTHPRKPGGVAYFDIDGRPIDTPENPPPSSPRKPASSAPIRSNSRTSPRTP